MLTCICRFTSAPACNNPITTFARPRSAALWSAVNPRYVNTIIRIVVRMNRLHEYHEHVQEFVKGNFWNNKSKEKTNKNKKTSTKQNHELTSSKTFTSAPACTSALTISRRPCSAALWRAVSPFYRNQSKCVHCKGFRNKEK